MKTTIFDGNQYSAQILNQLKEKYESINKKLKLVSIVFQEDKVGLTYTKLKSDASKQVGINFEKVEISFKDSIEKIQSIINNQSISPDVSGLLIQKPSKTLWQKEYKGKVSFYDWWESLTNQIDPTKDVDCLSRVNLESLYQHQSTFMPATAKAVIRILKIALNKDEFDNDWGDLTISIVGKSELAGKPLSEILSFYGAKTYLLGSKNNLNDFLPKSDIIISGTGVKNLITKSLIKENSILIDLGEPEGDIDFESVKNKASFITPVPGGVGPITVISLLDNLLIIINNVKRNS